VPAIEPVRVTTSQHRAHSGYRAMVMPGEPSVGRTLDDSKRRRARDLIHRLRAPRLPDKASGELFDELEKLLLYSGVADLLFWRTPELSVDDVIDEALRYRPFVG
jgi:hypothetical protein